MTGQGSSSRLLSESERSTITNGLRVAAERYKASIHLLSTDICPNCLDKPGSDGLGHTCQTCNGVGEVPTTKQINLDLAKAFERRYSDAIMLAQTIEEANHVEVIHA